MEQTAQNERFRSAKPENFTKKITTVVFVVVAVVAVVAVVVVAKKGLT